MTISASPHFTQDRVRLRMVAIAGARNLREMGGYPTRDGREVRRGILFRSGHPGDIPEEERQRLHDLGLRTIVDLRTTPERNDKPFPDTLLASVDYRTRDYEVSEGDIVRMLRDPDATVDGMAQQMARVYRAFPSEQREGLASLFSVIVESDDALPLLVNCTAGKDRTGLACALLLTALDVPEDIVRQDYALTERLHDPAGPLFAIDPTGPYAFLAKVDPAVWRAMMGSPESYIQASFDAIRDQFGTVESYLETELGIGEHERRIMKDRCLTR